VQQEHDRRISVASRPLEDFDSVYFNPINGCHRDREPRKDSTHKTSSELYAGVKMQPQCQTPQLFPKDDLVAKSLRARRIDTQRTKDICRPLSNG